MIVRGGSDPASLKRSLHSTVPYADEVCILETIVPGQTRTMDLQMAAAGVCDEYDKSMRWEIWEDPEGNTENEWVSDFAEARNRSQAMVTGDVWFWVDSDTVLVNGAGWRADVDKHFGAEGSQVGVMRVRYDYSFDARGRPNMVVPTKMVLRAGTSEWKCDWPVHEQPKIASGSWALLEATEANYWIEHAGKSEEANTDSSDRNFWIIQNHMQHGREMDARMFMSLATCQIQRENFPAALAAIRECLKREPGEVDRWRALSALGGVLQNMGHHDDALAAYGEMASLHPERKSPWVFIAQTHCNAERYKEALAALGRVDRYPNVSEGTLSNPVFLEYSPLQSAGRAYAALGDWDLAIDSFEKCLEIQPDIESVRGHLEALRKQQSVKRRYESYMDVSEANPEIWRLAPEDMDMLPEVARAKIPRRPRGKTTVMIWCGPPNSKPWGPGSLADGIGGSEEAVIYLSREFAQAGFHVEVYGCPPVGEAGTDDFGVVWVNHAGWQDKPGVFIQWRGTHMIEQATKASARYTWLHDVQYSMLPYTPKLREAIDGVLCLSESHAEPLVEHGWGDKVIQITNGLPPSVLGKVPVDRVDRSMAYYSAPDRGLETLLKVWRDIRYAVPDATLDIFYGFTPYWHVAMGRNPELRRVKDSIESMVADLEGCGVTWRGMVGHDELHEAMSKTDLWLYPTAFPETSCITAMKCMALGCMPVTSRFPGSALPETIGEYDLGPEPRSGSIYEDREWLDEWVQTVIKAARTPEAERSVNREDMQSWAKQHYAWSELVTTLALSFQEAGVSLGKGVTVASREATFSPTS